MIQAGHRVVTGVPHVILKCSFVRTCDSSRDIRPRFKQRNGDTKSNKLIDQQRNEV